MFFSVSVVIMETKKKFRPYPNLKLMDQTRQVLRYYHYWIVRYIKFKYFTQLSDLKRVKIYPTQSSQREKERKGRKVFAFFAWNLYLLAS